MTKIQETSPLQTVLYFWKRICLSTSTDNDVIVKANRARVRCENILAANQELDLVCGIVNNFQHNCPDGNLLTLQSIADQLRNIVVQLDLGCNSKELSEVVCCLATVILTSEIIWPKS